MYDVNIELRHILPLKAAREQMMLNFDLERTGTQLNSTEMFLTAVNKERGSSSLLNYTKRS